MIQTKQFLKLVALSLSLMIGEANKLYATDLLLSKPAGGRCSPVTVACFQNNLYEQQAPLFITVERTNKTHQDEEVCAILPSNIKTPAAAPSDGFIPIVPQYIQNIKETLNEACLMVNSRTSKEPAYATLKHGPSSCAAIKQKGWNTFTWWYDGELDRCWILSPNP